MQQPLREVAYALPPLHAQSNALLPQGTADRWALWLIMIVQIIQFIG